MQLHHIALALLLICIWGFNFVVIQLGLQGVSPLFLSTVQFFLTSIPAVFFIKRPKVPFRYIFGYGFTIFTLQFGLLFLGMDAGIPGGLASLLVQFQAFFSIFLAAVFLKEKIRAGQIIGALCAFAGIGLVGFHAFTSGSLLGFFLVIASAASWSFGNVISQKMGEVNVFSLVAWGSLIAWPCLLVLTLIKDGTSNFALQFRHIDLLSILAICYLAYLVTWLGFGTWSLLLHEYPLHTVAPFTLLIPVVAMASSSLVLHESLVAWKIIAGLLILIGLCLHVISSQRKA